MSRFMTIALGHKDKFDAAYEHCLESVVSIETDSPIESVTESVGETVKKAWDKIVAAVKSFVTKVKKFFTRIKQWLQRHWNAFVSKFTGDEKVEVANPDMMKKGDQLNHQAAESAAKGDFDSAKELADKAAEMYKSANENKVVVKLADDVKKRLESNLVSADLTGKTIEIVENACRQVPNTAGVVPWKKQGPQHGTRDTKTGKWNWAVGRKILNNVTWAERMRTAEIQRAAMPKAKAADPALADDPAVKLVAAQVAEHEKMMAA